jgi:hypothetical protein
MNTQTVSYKAVLQLADALVTHCLPPGFPNVATILYVAALGLSITFKAARTITSFTDL